MNNPIRKFNPISGTPLQPSATAIVNRGLKKRYAAERRFKAFGKVAVIVSLIFLFILFSSIIAKGYSAFFQTYIQLNIYIDPEKMDDGNLSSANYQGMVKDSILSEFPDVSGRAEKQKLFALVSPGAAYRLREMVMNDPSLVGGKQMIWVPADDDVDMFLKGHFDRRLDESQRRLNDQQLSWIDDLIKAGKIQRAFNRTFFTAGDSREPELAGILGAATGSFYALIITLLLSFPIGVLSAVYLEEFAPKNRWTDLIEVNINNLAAVPSIVFGLLGLAIFLNFFGLPRSAPLVGGLVLTLMTLPTIIIAARASLQSVPPSIREAALGIGASRMQMVTHHVIPLAMPGILTGTIIGMAQALGETAPLLMIGMVAFIADIPQGFTSPATALPVQIFLWADSPERAFVERTAAAIMVLVGFLIVMNATAVFLRKRFERRW
jgi:phosphate transport system permease protein